MKIMMNRHFGFKHKKNSCLSKWPRTELGIEQSTPINEIVHMFRWRNMILLDNFRSDKGN